MSLAVLLDTNEKALERATAMLECARAMGNKQLERKLTIQLLRLTLQKHKQRERFSLSQ